MHHLYRGGVLDMIPKMHQMEFWEGKILLLPPTRQDLTQGLFYSRGFRGGGVRVWVSSLALLDSVDHRLVWYNMSHVTQLDMDSLSRRWFHYSSVPARMPAYILNQARRSCAMLCLSMILRPPKGRPAIAEGHSVSNLSLTWYPIRHECQTSQLKSQENMSSGK